ncbi:SipW-dependent-type signal peptide-containing protein [Halorubrum rubrum]|uniref:SipW-dependent-type signal peptide-containing protein n=1 Tax=Halorubrum rubrum TaxID=1126240 RepID=A0ABD5QYV3_9EURY|nr:SipW-dependent-type signal peptide-containing protein [Halorubrum rubrum]
MPDEKLELSRRNALIGLGTVGAASAGAGLGTSAYFSDEESFEDNTLEAGELDLFVDYWTDANSEAIDGGTTGSDQNDGDVSMEYVLNDLKPGDSGKLVFCPKIVDNPTWLWAGSSGFTQYENGLTEPEEDVDDTGGDRGAGNGELADNVHVTVAYCEPTEDEPEGPDDFDTVRELDNPEDYTLADLLVELQTGYLLDGLVEDDDEWVPTDDGAYPASPDSDTQTGPCLCIDWNVPTAVGNVIQSDSVEFDIGFTAQQSRHNGDPDSPFVDAVLTSDATGGIRATDSWITASVSAGPTTVVRIDLDGDVYGGGDSGEGEWPSNEDVYFMEANIDVDNDGIDEAANDDDFRVGYAAENSGARAGAISNSSSGASGDGGYIRRNTGGSSSGDSAARTDVAEEDVPGFSAYESSDQLSYTLVIDWSAVAGDGDSPTADLSSAPTEIQINEVFGGDGGEGVGATPNSSNDGRGDVDTTTDGSGTLQI